MWVYILLKISCFLHSWRFLMLQVRPKKIFQKEIFQNSNFCWNSPKCLVFSTTYRGVTNKNTSWYQYFTTYRVVFLIIDNFDIFKILKVNKIMESFAQAKIGSTKNVCWQDGTFSTKTLEISTKNWYIMLQTGMTFPKILFTKLEFFQNFQNGKILIWNISF